MSLVGWWLVWWDGGGGGGGGDSTQLYISSSWVKIRLQTKNQLPRLPASTLFWWGCHCNCDCHRHCEGVNTKSTPSLLSKDFVWILTTIY